MGRTSDEEAESSRQTSSSDERPLKKARYIWQIKGKYHLKKDEEEEKEVSKTILPDSSVESSCVDIKCISNDIRELETNSMPLLANFILEDMTSLNEINQTVTTPYEIYSLSKTISNLELTKWQDQQVARCFVDNTINSVLEVMGFIPLPFDAADVLYDEFEVPSNREDNDDLEDEAVLMAIHSHGLQRCEKYEKGNRELQTKKCCYENNSLPCMCSQHVTITDEALALHPFHKRPVACLPNELVQEKENNINLTSIHSSVSTSSTINASVPYEESDTNNKKSDNLIIVSKDVTTELFTADGANVNVSKNVEDINSPLFDHNDFLDQAVAVAIKKKGLCTLSCSEF